MKIATFSTALASTAAAAAIALAGAPTASADTTTTTLGSQAELVDGAVVQGWTVKDLKRSSDVIAYPVHGVLWEATAADTAITGSVTPIVANFNARARNGETYRVLFGAATAQGVNPATLAQGQQTTGKLYFDVTGAEPDSVVYNAGGPDLLLWVSPPPIQRGGGTSSGSTGATVTPGGATSGSGAATASTPTAEPGQAHAQPASTGLGSSSPSLPTGSSGTPLPSGSQGTPIGSTGTPVGAPGTPTEGPLPAGRSQGTPQEAGTVSPAPASVVPSAVPPPATPGLAGTQSTPGTPIPSTTPVAPPPSA